MSEKKLKPCPFCGKEDGFMAVQRHDCRWSMVCLDCLASSPVVDELEETLEAWNRRAK